MFGYDVLFQVSGLATCFIAVRTLMRFQTLMDSLDMSPEVTSLRKFLITLLTTKRLLLGVDSHVNLEVGRSEEFLLPIFNI